MKRLFAFAVLVFLSLLGCRPPSGEEMEVIDYRGRVFVNKKPVFVSFNDHWGDVYENPNQIEGPYLTIPANMKFFALWYFYLDSQFEGRATVRCMEEIAFISLQEDKFAGLVGENFIFRWSMEFSTKGLFEEVSGERIEFSEYQKRFEGSRWPFPPNSAFVSPGKPWREE